MIDKLKTKENSPNFKPLKFCKKKFRQIKNQLDKEILKADSKFRY